jgi:hypothetical protein
VRKLIAFDDDTFDKLKQLGRDRMATIQETRHPRRPQGRAPQERVAFGGAGAKGRPAGVDEKGQIVRVGKVLACGSEVKPQPIFFRPFLNRGPLPT